MGAALSLSKYASSLTPAVAMNPANKQLSVLRKEDEASYLKVIAMLLMRTAELLNVSAANSLSTIQTADLTVRIGKQYYYLRMEELVYVFNRAQNGVYGKDYNRLDAPTVMGWIEQYDVNERTPLVVSLHERAAQQSDQKAVRHASDEELQEYVNRVAEPGEVVNVSQLGEEEKAKLQVNVEVQALYDQMAVGQKTKTDAGDQKRWTDRVPKTVQDEFAEARARYVREKQEGIVTDYAQAQSVDTDFEEIND